MELHQERWRSWCLIVDLVDDRPLSGVSRTVSLLSSEPIPRDSGAPAAARGTLVALPRKRTFVTLRFGFLIAASYLLLVARDFESPPATISAMIGAVLASNLLLMAVPGRFFEGVTLSGAVILIDMALVTAALFYSGEFGGEFFLLYFAVLFLAAVGESLPLIILAALVGSGAYFWIGVGKGGIASFWDSDTLIRFPFLLMVAVFFGYFVVRLRREQRRTNEEATVSAHLEQTRQALAEHAREVEEANAQLEVEVKERAQAEKELEDANFKLKQASQTKTDFISVVSHELRTPLASIKNALDLMGSNKLGELDEKRQRFLNMASRNTERLAAIINDLLDLSKVEAGKVDYEWTEVDLERLLAELCPSFEGQANEASITLELKCSTGLPLVWIDARRIEQVVTNLVSNALRHTEPGGRVTIWARPLAQGAEVAVSDTGIGISSQDQGRIFDRFFQVGDSLTREAKGTGLGLSIVKQLLAGHGSRIQVESELGKGSRFWFRVPTLSSETVEALDFETKVMRYKTQASFFSLLVIRLGSPETGLAETLPDKDQLQRLHEVVNVRFPRSADHVVLQPASGRVLLVLLMTPASGAEVVKERLASYLATQRQRGQAPDAVISGPALLPEDGSTGRMVVKAALERSGPREMMKEE